MFPGHGAGPLGGLHGGCLSWGDVSGGFPVSKVSCLSCLPGVPVRKVSLREKSPTLVTFFASGPDEMERENNATLRLFILFILFLSRLWGPTGQDRLFFWSLAVSGGLSWSSPI